MSLVTLAVPPDAAHAAGGRWLLDHGTAEWMTAAGGWRTALDNDRRVPGFDSLAGGTELVLGLDVYGPLGVVLDGKFLGGEQRGLAFLEGSGGLGLSLHASETIRVRAGAAAGQLTNGDESAVLVGGFLAGSFDLFSLGGGRLSLALGARLDVDAALGVRTLLPERSLALSVGLGLRY